MEPKTILRETAKRVAIGTLLNGKWSGEEDTFLLLPSLEKVHRVNVFATIVHQERRGNAADILIDDGTGQMVVRFFENFPVAETINRGSAVLVIGKLRRYNQENYLSPEIMKMVNPSWLRVRKRELDDAKREAGSLEKVAVERVEEAAALPAQKILHLIETLDQGEGAQIEEILRHSMLNDTEQILSMMLRQGQIFQNFPGRVKVL